MSSLAPARDALVGSWQDMLGHQLPQLPPFESYWDELRPFFAWLKSEIAIPELPSVPTLRGHEQVYRPAYGHLGIQAAARAPMEIVRFSAGNHLCVELYYEDEQGRRDTRTIEPYSLRRTQAGNVLLYAVRADDGQIRAYRVDRILGARVTNRRFTPRYAIELSPTVTNPLGTAASRATGNLSSLGLPHPSPGGLFYRPSSSQRRSAKRTPWSGGPIYVFRCTVCGKTFSRNRYDASLNPHKNRNAQPCHGRFGQHVRTRH
jgi:hypothetical protein